MKVELERIHKGLCPDAIPHGWRIVTLKELSLLKISNGAFNDPKLVGLGYKLINIVDLYRGPQIRTKDLGRLSLSESEYKTFKVLRGDLFFTRSSLKKEGIAHCNIFLSEEEDVVYECHMMRVRPNPELVDSKYLQEFCLAGPAREYFISHGKTTTMTTIDQGSIGGLPILLPPLPEQEKIAAILTAVDDKLDVISRQIQATQTLKQGLMQTLFSRGVGCQDANDWPVLSLQELAEVRTGVAKGKKGLKAPVELPYLRVANVQAGHIDLTEVKTIEVEATQVQRYALQPGDVLMTEGGDFDKLGRGDVWEGQISPCLHQNHVFSVRPAPDKLNSYYLAALAASDYGRRYFLSCAKRTTNLASINSSQLKAFPVLLPSLKVQEEIAKIVDAVNTKITVLEEKRTAHQTLKRGLMQKLLTGEWRVSLDAHQDTAIAA